MRGSPKSLVAVAPRLPGAYTLNPGGASLEFRTRLLRTLHAIEPILREEGVLVAGSEVPNLLEPGAGATLVVSQDVDIVVPIEHHAAVKAK